jgi:hypothetical protein
MFRANAIMFLKVHEYTLYLAAITRIGHANAQTNSVPVVGMMTGIDQATGELPSRMNVNVLEKQGGPMWYGIFLQFFISV